MTGPCLCGDPYCPRCVNPDLSKYEELFTELNQVLIRVTRAGIPVQEILQVWADAAEEAYYDEVKDQQEEAAYEARIAEAEREQEAIRAFWETPLTGEG